ncbi:LORF2 protein, partial [Crocuta crocuta]
LTHTLQEEKMVQLLFNPIRQNLLQLKTLLPYDPAPPLLAIYPGELKAGSRRALHTPVFLAALFTAAKIRKGPACPWLRERISRMWSVHTMEHYTALK